MAYRTKKSKPNSRHLRPKKSLLKMPGFWIAVLIILVVLSLGYFLLFYQKFQINEIKISGNHKVKSEDIENVVWSDVNKELISAGFINVSSKSIFITSKNKLIADLLVKFPIIEEVLVKKTMPNGLVFQIKERQPFAVFCKIEKCFLMDGRGILYEELKTDNQNMIVVRNNSLESPTLNKSAVDKGIIDDINKVQKSLKDNFEVEIKEVTDSNPLIFTTKENWKIYFDPTQDIDLQATKMNALLKNEISETDRKNLQYIYLQYKDRAYYK